MSGTTATVLFEADVSGASPRSSTPSYTDLTDYLLALPKIRRGRTYELAEMENGYSECLLDNSTRRFDPTYAAGPYYPNLKPMNKMRISVVLSAVTYRLYTGYALGWPPEWAGPGWSTVSVDCVDALATLALSDLNGSFSQEATGTRVGNVLDAIGFPAGDRVIDTGSSLAAAATFAATGGRKALNHIRDVERTENGLFYIDGQGRAVFKARHALLTAQATSQATFDDANASTLDYEDAPLDYSDKLIYNSVTVTDSAGNAVTVTDTASEDSYWPRSFSRSTLLPAGSSETTDAAQYLLALYKSPGFRFERVTFLAGMDDTTMLEALTRQIGDRITVKKTAPGGGAQIVQGCIVQSIEHSFDPASAAIWTTTYELAPATTAAFWALDSSALDTSTVLAY